MAELTKLEAKIGEVTGLAMAAQAATEKVIGLAKDEDESELVGKLERMHEQAAETEARCTDLAGTFEGKKTAILDEARTTKAKGAEMMSTYLDADADALDGFEFLTMAEAGEVGHWSVLKTLNKTAGNQEIDALVEWALPIQQAPPRRRDERIPAARKPGGSERACLMSVRSARGADVRDSYYRGRDASVGRHH